MNFELYTFIGWSVGAYRVSSHNIMKDGITLQFINSSTGEDGFFVHFNVELHRIRKVGKKAAGTRLPKNKFRVKSIRCKFYKFWLRTLLPTPRRTDGELNLSGFPDCMGKLKEVIFTANLISEKPKQLDKDTICEFLYSDDPVTNRTQQKSNNSLTTTQQSPNNFPTILSNKVLNESHTNNEVQSNPNVCNEKHVNKKSVNKEVCNKVDVNPNSISNISSGIDTNTEYSNHLKQLESVQSMNNPKKLSCEEKAMIIRKQRFESI